MEKEKVEYWLRRIAEAEARIVSRPSDLFERVHQRMLSPETQRWIEESNYRRAQDQSYIA